MRDAEGRKKEASKVKPSNKAKQRIVHQGKAMGTIHSLYIYMYYRTPSTLLTIDMSLAIMNNLTLSIPYYITTTMHIMS